MTSVLIIDDEPFNVQLLCDVLEYEGYEVLSALDGLTGLDIARANRPDLIICDIAMPNLDGYGVLHAVRTDSDISTIPFIILTAFTDRESMRHGMELGADDFITKPFKRTDVVAAAKTQLEKRSAHTKEAERRLEHVKQKLTRMVTHELRTPLTSIDASMHIINRQFGKLSPEELQEMLDMMGSGSRRLNRVIEQMVFVTQLETGYLNYDAILEGGIVTPLSKVLFPALDMARRFAHRNASGVIQLIEPKNSIDAYVRCHPQALKHALAELITNALDFSPTDAATVVEYGTIDELAWASIRDQGPGIPQELLETALQMFTQVNRDTQEQQGMGMGLPLAHQIVQAHGGDLQLWSTIGIGTKVLVTLPMVS